jgi:hypothetical protein
VVVHDAKPHPGDATGLIYSWLLNDIRAADTVVALSDWVKSELVGRGIAPAERTRALFMPDNIYPSSATERPPRRQPGQPLRILFFGRLLRYKGIPLFVEALYHRIVDQIGFASRSFSVKKFLRDLVDLSDGVAPSAKARQSTAVIAQGGEARLTRFLA